MEKSEISAWSVFVRREYVQHVESEWHASSCTRLRKQQILGNSDFPNGTAFAYEDSIHVGSGADSLSAKKVGGSGEADVDEVSSEK